MTETLGILPVAIGAVVVLFVLVGLLGNLYRRVGPNRALILYGWGGTHIVQGGGAMVVPLFQSAQELSLELMSFDVAPSQDLYTSQGVAVSVEAVSQIKVKSDPESIRTSAEQFLTKNPEQRESLIRLVMEGHLRGIVGLLTVEQIVKEPEMVAGRVRQTVADDLSKMGLEAVSFTIRKITDEADYIAAMGRPDVARVKREADIAQAEAARDTAIKRAMALREASVAQAQADQERVLAQTASDARQAEAQRDLEVKKAEYDAAVRQQRAVAEKAYEIASNQEQQKVAAEEVRIEQVKRQEQIRVQELEVERRQKELEATVIKPAEAERERVSLAAEAERQRTSVEAAGRAQAAREMGKAESEVIKIKGEAEGDAIRAHGDAEAEAMHKKADAYSEYSQAAVLDKMLGSMPELARAFAQALGNVDKITVVSTGDGARGGGASAFTGEIARMVAQMPEVIETITGQSMGDMVRRLPGLSAGHAEPPANGKTTVAPPASQPSAAPPNDVA